MKEDTKRILRVAIILGITIIIISHFDTIFSFMSKLFRLATPFIIGLFIAYLLTPITNKIIKKLENSKIKNKSYKKLNTIAIFIVEFVFLVFIVAVATGIATGVVGSGYNIIMKLPLAFEQFKDMLDDLIKNHSILKNLIGSTSTEVIDNAIKTIYDAISNNFQNIAQNVFINTKSVGRSVVDVIFGIIINIFALANRAQFKRQALKILKAISNEQVYNKTIDIFKTIDNRFSGFFIGKILDSAIVGVICIICMSILQMPYVMLISMIIFITNIVPIIGPIIGAIPSIIIIFSESPVQAIYFAIFILVLQQIDGHIIGPKCIGSAIGLNTFYVLFALIVAGGLWGIPGMIIGVPLFSAFYSIINEAVSYLISKKHME